MAQQYVQIKLADAADIQGIGNNVTLMQPQTENVIVDMLTI